ANAGVAVELDVAAADVRLAARVEIDRAADRVEPAQAHQGALVVDQAEVVADAVAGQHEVPDQVKAGPRGPGLEVQGRTRPDGGGGLDGVAAVDEAAERQVVLDSHPALVDEGIADVAVGVGQDEVAVVLVGGRRRGADVEGGPPAAADVAEDRQAVVVGEVQGGVRRGLAVVLLAVDADAGAAAEQSNRAEPLVDAADAVQGADAADAGADEVDGLVD